MNAEVVFKPIKIPIASDPGRRKVVHDICGDYMRNLVKLVNTAFQAGREGCEKAIISGQKGGGG